MAAIYWPATMASGVGVDRVFAWGRGCNGELGRGSFLPGDAIGTIERVADLEPWAVADVGAGLFHSMAITAEVRRGHRPRAGRGRASLAPTAARRVTSSSGARVRAASWATDSVSPPRVPCTCARSACTGGGSASSPAAGATQPPSAAMDKSSSGAVRDRVSSARVGALARRPTPSSPALFPASGPSWPSPQGRRTSSPS